MFNRLWKRFILLEEAGDTGSAGGGAAATASADTSAAADPAGAGGTGAEKPAAETGLEAPDSLLGDKPAEEKKPEDGEKKPGEEKPADDKPIEYADFAVPEGMQLDADQMTQFKAIAAASKLPQEAAQQMVDMHVAEMKKAQEAPYRAWNELQTKWRDEVKNDPVIGGANLDKNLAATKAGLQSLLGNDAPKFFEALNITGAGNNPDIVRGLMKAAAPHAPATPIGGNPGGGAKTAGATLYPTQAGLGNGHSD